MSLAKLQINNKQKDINASAGGSIDIGGSIGGSVSGGASLGGSLDLSASSSGGFILQATRSIVLNAISASGYADTPEKGMQEKIAQLNKITDENLRKNNPNYDDNESLVAESIAGNLTGFMMGQPDSLPPPPVPVTPPSASITVDITTESVQLSLGLEGGTIPTGSFEISWEQKSGPGNAIFTDPTGMSTEAFFTESGGYTIAAKYTSEEYSYMNSATVYFDTEGDASYSSSSSSWEPPQPTGSCPLSMDYYNMLVDALNQRILATNASLQISHVTQDLIQGSTTAYYAIRSLQNTVLDILGKYVVVMNSYEGLTEFPMMTPAILYSQIGNPSGFRRATEWDGITEPIYSYGLAQEGDVYGPWICEDLVNSMEAMKWTLSGKNYIGGGVNIRGINKQRRYLASSFASCSTAYNSIIQQWPNAFLPWESYDDPDGYVFYAVASLVFDASGSQAIRARAKFEVTSWYNTISSSIDIYGIPTHWTDRSLEFMDFDTMGIHKGLIHKLETLPSSTGTIRNGSIYHGDTVINPGTNPLTLSGLACPYSEIFCKSWAFKDVYGIHKWNFSRIPY